MVSEYIEMLWETGEPKSTANYTVAAIQHYRPQSKQRLPWSWKLVKVWNQVELPNRATPISPEMVLALAGVAFKWRQHIFGWLIIVGFALFLRTGELLKLQPEDVTFTPKKAIVFVQSSKGAKKVFLPLERLELVEPSALQAVKELLKRSKSGKPFWQESRRSFMDTWHSIVAELKLPHGFYKPYSLRRGGATSCYKNGCTLDELVTRGRWQHVHSPDLSGHWTPSFSHSQNPLSRPTLYPSRHRSLCDCEPAGGAWKGLHPGLVASIMGRAGLGVWWLGLP